MERPEKVLGPPVSALLERQGYNLVMPSAGGRVTGKGEFGIDVPGAPRPRRVDVVAARWNGDQDIKAVAVECKVTVWAVYDGLGQAVQYQSLFDEVYVATPDTLEKDSIARSTLVDLGLGHIRVVEGTGLAYVSVVPQAQRASRFEPHRKLADITCRLALGLAFLELAACERPLRYGFGQQGRSTWYAEEVVGHLQWNCWWPAYRPDGSRAEETWAGINVEHAGDTRRICSGVSAERLQNTLARLPPQCLLEVSYNPTPPTPGRASVVALEGPAQAATAQDVLDRLRGCPPKYKPGLWLGIRLPTQQSQHFSRSEYVEHLRGVRQHLSPVMEVLQDCYRDCGDV